MATLTERTYLDEVIVAEWDQRFNRDEITLTNDSGGELSMAPGTTLVYNAGVYNPAVATTDQVDGVLCEQIDNLADAASVTTAALVRGPALVNSDKLLAGDQTAAAAVDIADLTDGTLNSGLSMKFVTNPADANTQSGA